MAKLFGVNYEKEGKGVKKNEPQKKAFFKFFDMYSISYTAIFNLSQGSIFVK